MATCEEKSVSINSHYAAVSATGCEGLGLICRSIDDAEERRYRGPFQGRDYFWARR